ncbi:TVP38/TMEM64 family protein [Paenibacillus puerhi]|uniref:TVP38/TMEM64 family protein n=1 Tax=Paenibacillus puerhi TaxID=2692622 RepID=UPI00135C71D5|nr:VTT domain-containing protein [Paenibacillus puerhi]
MSQWNVEHVSEVLGSLGWLGYAGGAMLVLLHAVLPFIPFVVAAGVNVLLFGFWGGFAVNYICACVGAVFAYFLARNLGRSWVQGKLAGYSFLGKVNGLLERYGLWCIAASRVVPVLPSSVVSIGAAFMKVRTRHFILGTLIGNAPMIWLESMVGHDLIHFGQHKERLLVLGAVLLVMFALGTYFRRKWTRTSSSGSARDSGKTKPTKR